MALNCIPNYEPQLSHVHYDLFDFLKIIIEKKKMRQFYLSNTCTSGASSGATAFESLCTKQELLVSKVDFIGFCLYVVLYIS